MSNFICLDLEASCNDQPKLDPDLMEIIEIGACFVSKEGVVLDQFQTFVKPSSIDPLTAFCTQLTTITQADVDSAPGFVDAVSAFEQWIDRCVALHGALDFWGSWGEYDRKQFERNAKLVGADVPGFLSTYPHRNLKVMYGNAVGLVGKGVGLGKALNCEGIKFVGVKHRGIDDAKNMVSLSLIGLGLKESAWRDRPNLRHPSSQGKR